MYRYDLHVHSAERSPCSLSTAEEMCLAALDRGLSGIALTDHDVWWPEEEIGRLRARFPDLSILPGAEVALDDGHFLVFVPGRKPPLPFQGGVEDLARAVHSAGGILIWAHPFRYDRSDPDWLDRVALDGLEVASGNMDGDAASRASAVAARTGLARFRNSDAHHAEVVGRYWNGLGRPVADEEALVRAIRSPSR